MLHHLEELPELLSRSFGISVTHRFSSLRSLVRWLVECWQAVRRSSCRPVRGCSAAVAVVSLGSSTAATSIPSIALTARFSRMCGGCGLCAHHRRFFVWGMYCRPSQRFRHLSQFGTPGNPTAYPLPRVRCRAPLHRRFRRVYGFRDSPNAHTCVVQLDDQRRQFLPVQSFGDQLEPVGQMAPASSETLVLYGLSALSFPANKSASLSRCPPAASAMR